MGSGASRDIFRAFGASGAALVFIGLGVSLSGCPWAAELENPDRFDAGSRDSDCSQLIPDLSSVLNCDYAGILRSHCTTSACHAAPTATRQSAGELDLTLDSLLIARILEVPSKHRITCANVPCDLANPQCDSCRECPTGDFLLTKTNVAESWIIKKMERFNVDMPAAVPDIGCGYAMPYLPANRGFTAEKRTCLTNFFTWIADNGRKCDVSVGGSGGSGGTAGGSGGTGGT